MPSILTLQNIGKFYGERLIFKNISLNIGSNALYLLTGANGAGKSTLLRIISGLAKPDSGKITKADSIKTAYIGHNTFIYPALTAMQNLKFWTKIYGIKTDRAAIMSALEKVRLEKRAHDQARTFSRGMAQRLNFARALLLSANLYLLDEPFSGMDGTSRCMLRRELGVLRDNGATILLVTHEPEEDAKDADGIFTLEKHTLNFSPVPENAC